MKSVLISIKPQFCELIASGKKTIDVRNTRPKIETPFKVYIYCTQSGKYVDGKQVKNIWVNRGTDNRYIGNGKVIGEFVCDKVENIFSLSRFWLGETIEESTCWSSKEIIEYSKGSKKIYGWNISALKIYDKSRELSEFGSLSRTEDWERGTEHFRITGKWYKPLKRPPQSWCYVEEIETNLQLNQEKV